MEQFKDLSITIRSVMPERKKTNTLNKAERKKLHTYQLIVNFAAYTEKLIATGNWIKTKKCFQVAEHIYRNGNEMIKVALEHIFIPRLHLECEDRFHQQARSMLPFCLMRSYILLYHPK